MTAACLSKADFEQKDFLLKRERERERERESKSFEKAAFLSALKFLKANGMKLKNEN